MLRPLIVSGLNLLRSQASKFRKTDNRSQAHKHHKRVQPRILSDQQIFECMGRFWDLFNRLQSGRAQGVLGLCCVPGDYGLEKYMSPGKTRKIIKTPQGRFCTETRRQAAELIEVLEQRVEIRHLVILVSACSSKSESVEEHCLRVIRSIAGVKQLGDGIARGRIRLHAWMEDERGKFQVLHPKQGVFVSPLALRGAT